jgi:type IV pilus assembly protein PilM
MANALASLTGLLQDPPPEYAFELAPGHLAVARTGKSPQIQAREMEPDVLSVHPLRDNVLRPEALTAHIRAAAPGNGSRKRRTAALILPDYCVRVAVLDFDAFPSDPKEQLSLIRFRLKKSLPFDVEAAATSYFVQHGSNTKRVDVVAAVAPLEIVARYEAPFRSCNFQVGLLTTATLAALELVPAGGVKLLVKRSGSVLSLAAVERGSLRLIRSMDLSGTGFPEVLAELYPTLAYVEDQLAAKPDQMLLCGFGPSTQEAQSLFESELGVPAAPVTSRFGPTSEFNAGLLGYIESQEEF